MNPAKRKLIINLAILRVLDSCGAVLWRQDVLFQQVGLEVTPTMLLSEFEDCLRGLESLHFAVAVSDELGGDVKWKLTDLGKAKLRER